MSATHALQCLEGPRDAVNTIYNLVAADKRHTNVTLLRYVEAWRRLFPVWDMGFTSDLATAAPESARWHDDSGFNPVSYTHLDVYKRQETQGLRRVPLPGAPPHWAAIPARRAG